ncbi:MAG TPA: glycosyltransferase family 4 protein [Actinomycetota bacterium]|nr:glycosyltransferase family 4 protein [Actinomycetota bacterium]
MRVLHLISSSGVYGAEKMVVGLCEALPQHGVDAVLEVFDNTHSRNVDVAGYADSFGVPVRLLPCGGRFDPRTVRRLRRDIADQEVDLVHAHGYKANLYGFLATRAGVPIVATNHRFDTGPLNRFDKPVLRRFAAVYAVSDEARDSLRDVYGIADALTIPNGIDPRSFQDVPATLDLPRPLVAMVARLAPEKAPGDYLAVAAALPEAAFAVVGDGPMRAELAAAATSNVHFLGFRDDMPGVYASLDVLVQPSYREGMPMTILEAMASGVPVVATRVGAAADVIEEGRTGLLVDAGDVAGLTRAVHSLLADEPLRITMGQAARTAVAEQFTVGVMAGRYAREYRKVLAESR